MHLTETQREHLAGRLRDERERVLGVLALELSRLTRELGEIEDAMMRLEAEPERFGHDERTGEDIPFERLDMVPWARTRGNEPPREATNVIAADSDVLSAYRNERYAG